MAVAPNFNLFGVGVFRLKHLPADRCRRLLTSAVPRSMRTIHIVITNDSCIDLEVLAEMAAHAFAEKLFPTVSILGHGWISIGLLECDHIRNRLFACCINACRRGKEEAVHFVLLCSHQKVRVD